MLADFETRFATVLGASLPAPFAGRVTVAPGTPAGPGPMMQVALTGASRIEQDLGSFRLERPAGLPAALRVARLRTGVGISVTPAASADRAQTVEGVDRLIYLLDDASFRSGEALVAPGDQGFLLQELTLTGATLPEDEGAAQVTLSASGWFWPLGEPGVAGIAIAEVQVRHFGLPVSLRVPRLFAGAGPANLTLTLGLAGTMRDRADGVTVQPFGRLSVAVIAPDGSPGAGALGGGVGGGPEARVLDADAPPLTFTYTPPAAPGRDLLIVRSVRADGAIGLELARFDLMTEPPL